jgi:hypothetical protein
VKPASHLDAGWGADRIGRRVNVGCLIDMRKTTAFRFEHALIGAIVALTHVNAAWKFLA